MYGLNITPAVVVARRAMAVTSGHVKKVHGCVIVPPLSLGSNSWLGCSRLVATMHFTVRQPMTTRFLYLSNLQCDGYLLAIRFRIDTLIYRYRLGSDNTELLYIDQYTNQPIPKNFILEVWTTQKSVLGINVPENTFKLQLSSMYNPEPITSTDDVVEDTADIYTTEIDFAIPANLPIEQDESMTGIDNKVLPTDLITSGDWLVSGTDIISK